MRTAGAEVGHTFVVFFYGIFPQTEAMLAAHGLQLHYLATWRDVLAEARAGGHFDAATLAEVEAFLAAPLDWSAAHGGVAEVAELIPRRRTSACFSNCFDNRRQSRLAPDAAEFRPDARGKAP